MWNLEEHSWLWCYPGRSQDSCCSDSIIIFDADQGKFDWDLTDQDQGNFEIEIMVFLWFTEDGSPTEAEIQQWWNTNPVKACGHNVRATLESEPVNRPWNKTQAVFLGTIREFAHLERNVFDIRWVDNLLPLCVVCSWRKKKHRPPTT